MDDLINRHWNWKTAHDFVPVIMFIVIGSAFIGREIWWRLKNRSK